MSFGMMEALLSFFRRQVGLRTDGANATGSLHAKTARINDVWNRVDANLDQKISLTGIKSIQRGLCTDASETNINISISTVNPDKCVVLLTPVMFTLGGGDASSISYVYLPTLVSISQNVIIVTPSHSRLPSGGGNSGQIQWQVIEFY